eukprot:73602-Rhodomonas_salina.3
MDAMRCQVANKAPMPVPCTSRMLLGHVTHLLVRVLHLLAVVADPDEHHLRPSHVTPARSAPRSRHTGSFGTTVTSHCLTARTRRSRPAGL